PAPYVAYPPLPSGFRRGRVVRGLRLTVPLDGFPHLFVDLPKRHATRALWFVGIGIRMAIGIVCHWSCLDWVTVAVASLAADNRYIRPVAQQVIRARLGQPD